MAKAKLTLNDMLKNTKKAFPKRFSSSKEANTRVSRMIITPFVGTKILSVRADVKGEAEPKTYKVIITFQDIEYSLEQDADHWIRVKSSPGKTVWMAPLTANNRVQVRCSCLDFYFTFGYWNWTVGSLYGRKPKPYVRKTKTYPERNPTHTPGLCKHLVAVVNRIKHGRKFRALAV